MKTNTTTEYLYKGDYYSYTAVTSADGTVTSKTYETVHVIVNMALSINLLGELVIKSPIKMQVAGIIKEIIDRNDDLIYADGVWEIIQTAPILGPLGVKGGYQYRAILIAGEV